MPRSATRDDVQRLLQEGAQLVDVLPEAEYRDEHIAGAVSIPLKKLDRRTTAHLDRDLPVIVYCHDLF
ncbi:MAG: rhodanese-like domain-containing protein [Chloroflexi bacterium]|nr:rhodanese-like domain-containing protein [Chloroflexota bacterium]